jgi:hypothetical protein
MQKSGTQTSWLNCTDGIATNMQDLLILIARITFGLLFVTGGGRIAIDAMIGRRS